MAVLIVPKLDLSVPTLGPQLEEFLKERAVFGPGSLQGQPARLDDEKRAALYRLYEVYPMGHRLAGRRLFKRGGLEWRKGLAKTEFAAWVCYLELHPEAPVRADGFHSDGTLRQGRPVVSPVIPMMAVTEEQVSELAYGVLKWVIDEGPDADMFDTSLERIVRLDERGREDGKAMPVSGAPGSRDGARTTFQHFDEPHRLFLQRLKDAHETMVANLSKRPLEDPWSFYTSTAGQPGQNSIEEDLHHEAEMIDRGEIADPALFFFARWAGPEHRDLLPRPATESSPAVTSAQALKNRIAAVKDSTGPSGEYGPGQFEDIAKQWDRPKADHAYLERVWLNRWRQSNARMFDAMRIKELARPGEHIPAGAFITLGFDGARYRDSTAIVATEIETGLQEMLGLWERPADALEWEVDETAVTDVVRDAIRRFDVWKLYGDPPHWTETMGSWSGRWPDQIEEWWTLNRKRAAYAAREYGEAMESGSVSFGGSDDPEAKFAAHSDLLRHLGQTGTKDTRLLDDEGKPLLIMAKPDGRQEMKIDASVAGNLSWKARLDAIAAGAKPRKKPKNRISRIR